MTTDLREALRLESSRIEEDCIYSARGHFEAATPWRFTHFTLGVPTALLAAAAGASAFQQEQILAGSLALTVAVLSAINTFLNPRAYADRHHVAGAKFTAVRNAARMLRQVELPAADDPRELISRLKELSERRDALNLESPPISRRAFERARKSIESGEASYAVDAPAALPDK